MAATWESDNAADRSDGERQEERAPMPTFIDRHPFADVPSAVRQQLHLEAVRGFVDKDGAHRLGHWITDGVIYCVLQVPSLEVFCRHHAERGLPCDDVHELGDLGGGDPRHRRAVAQRSAC